MYDGIKFYIGRLAASKIMELPFLNFDFGQRNNGKGRPYNIAWWHGLKIVIYPTHLQESYIQGSIHKFYNSISGHGEHNYNDYSIEQVKESLEYIKTHLGINFDQCKVTNLEFGVNVIAPIQCNLLLSKIIHWNYCTHTRKEQYDHNGTFLEYKKGNARQSIKIYTKGIQYAQNPHLTRIEIRLLDTREIQRKTKHNKDVYLSNLLDVDIIKNLSKSLLSAFDKFLIVDTLEYEKQETNPLYWQNPPTKKQRWETNKKYREYLEQYNQNTLQKTIRKTIVDNLEFLSNGNFAHVVKECKHSNTEFKYCIITGIDITHQKECSKFVFDTTVRELYETDPKTYNWLLSEFGPKGLYNLDKEFNHIAHNIRNAYYNNKYSIDRKKVKYQNSLFPLVDVQ